MTPKSWVENGTDKIGGEGAWLRTAEQTARKIEKISENIAEEEIRERLIEIREPIC